MTGGRWLAGSAAAATGLALTACANLPTSGTVQLRSLQGGGGSGQLGVQVAPIAPGRAWRPDDIVNGFLAASASNDRNHAVAREYLTGGTEGGVARWRRLLPKARWASAPVRAFASLDRTQRGIVMPPRRKFVGDRGVSRA